MSDAYFLLSNKKKVKEKIIFNCYKISITKKGQMVTTNNDIQISDLQACNGVLIALSVNLATVPL